MSNLAKILIAIFLLFTIYAIYTLRSNDDIGSFERVRAGGEINQAINVLVLSSKGFERDRNNNIISFYARDNSNAEAKINLDEAAPPEIINAEVVEVFGHMHGDNFIAKRLSTVKERE